MNGKSRIIETPREVVLRDIVKDEYGLHKVSAVARYIPTVRTISVNTVQILVGPVLSDYLEATDLLSLLKEQTRSLEGREYQLTEIRTDYHGRSHLSLEDEGVILYVGCE